MRTTLDIDDDILRIAKDRAKAEDKSAGRVISDLVRKALQDTGARLEMCEIEIRDGIPVLPSQSVVVAKELVDELIEESNE
jgi:hypothetical protein